MTASTDPRVPDFFIVGHPKSGTSALYEALRSHPQIFMPELKEPVYFATELARQAHRYTAPSTLEDYLSLFAGADRQNAGLGRVNNGRKFAHAVHAEI